MYMHTLDNDNLIEPILFLVPIQYLLPRYADRYDNGDDASLCSMSIKTL